MSVLFPGFRLMMVVLMVLAHFDESNGAEGVPPRPSAIFVFGDSTVDDGNSNFLNSRAKSNYYPYGVDYPGGATGRSTNGKTFADLLGEWLGLPAPPPFADPNSNGNKILGGVNYASAGAGILDETARHLVIDNTPPHSPSILNPTFGLALNYSF
ncbi:unnamed protein product [Cuscuta epithymum]|uniref:GDSL esterase/lipase n=1 Tax=Cuscuta epithymum TaxID=186058 RepID=A0AAV0D361_9ASTE|nr:unnamed protein product [Cuscuta epithymum]